MLIKLIFDRLMSFIGILLLLPALLVIAILIKIKMPDGPVVFKQKRVGLHGCLFVMYKFRTMIVNHHGGSVSVAGETRITPLGAFLRKYKLDELPEIWNVLIGDMSFVGPRPEVPAFADRLSTQERKILEMRPGITCPASIKYSNEEEILSKVEDPNRYNDEIIYPDKVKLNLEYNRTRSFTGDLIIIFKTIFRVKTS
jgi:lipopolysaccharide/colanic/teichoic acid biosynthesis glycosyltransferase